MEEVVRAVRDSWKEVQASVLPAKLDSSGAGLSRRARNALRNAHGRARNSGFQWRDRVPLGALAKQPGVGPKTLLEWLLAGEALEAVEGKEVRGGQIKAKTHGPSSLQRNAELVLRRRWAVEVRATDPRLGSLVRGLCSDASTAAEAADFLTKALPEPKETQRLLAMLNALRLKTESFKKLTLEEELCQVVDTIGKLSASGREGLMRRTGLSGAPPQTLADAGEAAQLTRERVRQIERRFRERVARRRPWMPILDRVLLVVAATVPVSVDLLTDILRQRRLIATRFSIEALISVASIFQRDTEFRVEERLVLPIASLTARKVLATARRLTSHWGAVTVESLVTELRISEARDHETVRLILNAGNEIEWLDDEQRWFWAPSAKRNRLLNYVAKIISVAGVIQIGELREGVGRFHRMKGFRPPREVLARLCVQSGRYQRSGDQIHEGPTLPPWEEVLGDSIERKLVEILFDHGPLMRRDELERIAVQEFAINRNSFAIYLSYSPVIARYAPGVYGLRGARVDPGLVNALIPHRVRGQRLLDSGWTSGGSLWMAYKLSASGVQSGVLSIPVQYRTLAEGTYRFSSQRQLLGELTLTKGFIRGLRSFFLRWGAEENDFFAITVELVSRQAEVMIGGEEILLRFQQGE